MLHDLAILLLCAAGFIAVLQNVVATRERNARKRRTRRRRAASAPVRQARATVRKVKRGVR